MEDIEKWHFEKLGNKAVENFKKNRFNAFYFSNISEALAYLEKNIEEHNIIGFGGSVTVLNNLKLQLVAKKHGKITLNHNAPDLTQDERLIIRRKELTSDLFITSTNAITLDGKLVNIDGTGNRVAAMIFGPKKVIIVCGVNKIVQNVEEALERIKFIASPMNAKRVNSKTPCVETGFCMDCNSIERICNVITIIEKKPSLSNIDVVIIGEYLGF